MVAHMYSLTCESPFCLYMFHKSCFFIFLQDISVNIHKPDIKIFFKTIGSVVKRKGAR